MNDGAALLAAVRAHPGEDTPRLAYADWLQDHGAEDRAAYIRAAVAAPDRAFAALVAADPFPLLGLVSLGTEPVTASDGGAETGWVEERAWLWAELGAVGPALYDCGRKVWYVVRRGLIEAVRCDGAQWECCAADLLAAHPICFVYLLAGSDPDALSGRWPGVAFGPWESLWACPVGWVPPRCAEIACGNPLRVDAHGPYRARVFQVSNCESWAAATATAVSLGDRHPTDPAFVAVGFQTRAALAINRCWTVTVTYRRTPEPTCPILSPTNRPRPGAGAAGSPARSAKDRWR